MADKTDEEIQAAFKAAQTGWADALRAHRLAPPDAGYSARLLALCRAAHAEAMICWAAHEAGYKWPRHRAAAGEPPYELRPESGRRGPEVAWQRFDAAVEALNRATRGTDLQRAGSAYEEMAVAAGALAGRDRARGPRGWSASCEAATREKAISVHPGAEVSLRPSMAESIEQFSYELTANALAEQERAVGALRARAGTVLAAASIAGSFLGTKARHGSLDGWAVAALITFALCLASAVWVLFPRRFVFAVRGGMLLTQTDLLGIEDVAEAYRAAISWIEPHLDRNQYKLARISGWFNVACVLLVAEVVVWTLSLTS